MEKMDVDVTHRITCHDEECICGGDCILARQAGYFDVYFGLCKDLCALFTTDEGEALLDVILGQNGYCFEPQSILLFDWRLDTTYDGLMIECKDEEMRDLVFEHLFNILEEIIDEVTEFGPKAHLLLWLAACVGNVPTIAGILETVGNQIPSCVMQSLLLRAITVRSPELVSLLLENGALPNKTLRLRKEDGPNDMRPITVCADAFKKTLSQDQLGNLHKVLKILFSACKGGPSPFAPTEDNEDDDLQSLDYAGHICSASLESGGYFLEQAKAYLNTPFVGGGGALDHLLEGLTSVLENLPIVLQLFDGDNLPFPLVIPASVISEMLPLMRAGCRIVANGFAAKFSIWFSVLYPRFLKHNVAEQIWGKPITALVELLLETRSDRVTKLKMDCLFSRLDVGFNVVETVVPFRLQAVARRAVLKHLPFGYTSRTGAIESLRLPNCLKDYLNFKEFDVIPETLSTEGFNPLPWR